MKRAFADERWYEKRVKIAHARARTETMKRTRMEAGVRALTLVKRSTNQASMPMMGIKVMICPILVRTKMSAKIMLGGVELLRFG